MTVAAAINTALPYLRGEAEARMRATCRIERPGDPVDDGRGGIETVTELIYEGRCRMRYPGLAFESNLRVGAGSVVQSRVIVHVPFGAQYLPGDVVTVVSDLDTPRLAGSVYRVASVDEQSQATAQRLLCEDNQSGV